VDEPSKVYIPNPDRLVSDCMRRIREVLSNKQLGFDTKEAPGNTMLYQLTGPQVQAARNKKFNFLVVPFLETSLTIYWLTITLEFKYFVKKNYLMSVSIIVFEGARSQLLTNPLLRAEWMFTNDASDGSYIHAQPHWHVYPSAINDILTVQFDLGLVLDHGRQADYVERCRDLSNTALYSMSSRSGSFKGS
jgi:hypothetical protein